MLMMVLPDEMRWLAWDVHFDALDVERDAHYLLGRILEHGRLRDVAWALQTYGDERIHGYLRDVANPELSPSTTAFWRAYFHAENEPWATPPAWRTTNSPPWPG